MRERYIEWPVTAKILFWLFVVAIVIPLLFAIVAYMLPADVEEVKPEHVPGISLIAPASAEAHFRDDDRRNLVRAREHFGHGHGDHARQYVRRVRHWNHVPLRVTKHLRGNLVHRDGCKDASVEGRRDIPVPILSDPWLVYAAMYVGRFCFGDGRVKSVSTAFKYHGESGWGRQLNWDFFGWSPIGESRWESWHGRPHGSYVIRKVAQFEQCSPTYVGGCGFFYQIKNIALKFRFFGDGHWEGYVG